jgi:serine/threonine protein kinase
MAPEIYKRESYTSKVDVWSLGIIAYQLLFN